MPENTPLIFSALPTDSAKLLRKPELSADDIASLKAGDLAVFSESWTSRNTVRELKARGIHARTVKHWHESETIQEKGRRKCVSPDYTTLANSRGSAKLGDFYDKQWVEASRSAFAITWDGLTIPPEPNPVYAQATEHVPADWVPFLPYPTLNPAQVQAMPHIRSDQNLIVVAPTGAGKTIVGMSAALQEIKVRGGKAAWLVPQRTLTAELDRDLQPWREKGLRVERLSGEHAVDADAVANADLLVATTEKFEALCRATSMAETIASVGTIIVDEIHLLGEPGRGAVMEALLARIRGAQTGVRIIGLSATVANADQVAEWLRATLVRIAWRPTRLNQQVLTIPNEDKSTENKLRNSVAVNLTKEITNHGGSVVIFCGSKFNIRSTALAVAQSRGRDISKVDPEDTDAVAEIIHEAGIGIHYSDWPHRHRSEKEFREKTFDVLVATSTVAAGVNLPARAVIVRDTSIGPTMMEVSQIQQMVGRAGRAGKESEGWAFIVTRSDETAKWRQRLAAGYYVHSRIADSLADHILGEMVQGKITTRKEAEEWWVETFAHHQRKAKLTDLAEAIDWLDKWGFVKSEAEDTEVRIAATQLGTLTSRMMINVSDAQSLRISLATRPTAPRSAVEAENVLIQTLATQVYGFSNISSPGAQEQKRALMKVVQAEGDMARMREAKVYSNSAGNVSCDGTHVVMAALYLVAHAPSVIAHKDRMVAGIPRGTLTFALNESPRYLAWLSAQGPMGTVPPWSSIVARDLGQRVKYFELAPVRGDGVRLEEVEKRFPANQRFREVPKNFLSGAPLGGKSPKTQVKKEGRVAKVGITGAESFSAYALHQPMQGKPEWRRVSLTNGSGAATVEGSGTIAAFDNKGRMFGSGWLAAFTS
jgi:helicase